LTDRSSIQRWLCRDYGYRFSEFNVKVDVGGKFGEGFETVDELAHAGMASGNFAAKKFLNEASFESGKMREYMMGLYQRKKTINSFRDNIRNRRVCAPELAAKNSVAKAVEALAKEKI
jgi:hypothetical protein